MTNSPLPTLTEDQQAAADAFVAFLASGAPEFVISGGAGVGKSTLLRYLHDGTFLNNVATLFGLKLPQLDWQFTATTNKAAEVLQSMGFHDACTIHSYLGIKVSNDFEAGTTRIERTSRSPIMRDKLIVIDECSMVDTKLRKLIQEGTYNCRILYVGDHCQMAPITETLSPVFKDTIPAVINEIVRSKNAPPITELCLQLRETVETGVFKKIQEVSGFIDYLTPAQAQQELHDHFVLNQGEEDRVLYFRNESVLAMNDWIRAQRGLPPEFQPGETLVSNGATNAIATPSGNAYMLSVEQQIHIDNVSPVEKLDLRAYNIDAEIETYTVDSQYGTYRVAKYPAHLKQALQILSRAKSWHNFFRLKEDFADLRMREACTVYKAQGSTYRTVFIDLGDIARCNNPAQVARMLYVACSRPTHRICFIGRLPEKYGG